MKRQTIPFILLAQIAVTPLAGQPAAMLIGPDTRNGSFETGAAAPWSDYGLTVEHNAAFASHGEWYAAQAVLAMGQVVRSPGISQLVSGDRSGGSTFVLVFDVRNGVSAFDALRVSFGARDNLGVFVYTTNLVRSLSLDGWETCQEQYQVPPAWNHGELFVGFQFEKNGAIVGTTYRGYFDNIVLQQVPEPATGALLALGLGGLLAARRRLSRSPAGPPRSRPAAPVAAEIPGQP